MKEICHPSLGQAWLNALRQVCDAGQTVDGEILELRNLGVTFAAADLQADPLLTRFADPQAIAEMHKVFFTSEPNRFGHSYHDRLRGPQGRNDLRDVIELLLREPYSKRAVATLVGAGDGHVPCVNAIHFLCREGGLVATYFARAQDLFRKFYADALCIDAMARQVATALSMPVLAVSGLISSAHVYVRDGAEIQQLLSAWEAVV